MAVLKRVDPPAGDKIFAGFGSSGGVVGAVGTDSVVVTAGVAGQLTGGIGVGTTDVVAAAAAVEDAGGVPTGSAEVVAAGVVPTAGVVPPAAEVSGAAVVACADVVATAVLDPAVVGTAVVGPAVVGTALMVGVGLDDVVVAGTEPLDEPGVVLPVCAEEVVDGTVAAGPAGDDPAGDDAGASDAGTDDVAGG